MQEQQIYTNVQMLHMAHVDIVNKQAKHGNATLLVSITWLCIFTVAMSHVCILRLTIMVVDCSLWLSSSLNEKYECWLTDW